DWSSDVCSSDLDGYTTSKKKISVNTKCYIKSIFRSYILIMKIILKKDDVTIIELRHIYSVSKILAKISYGLQRFSNRSFPDFCGFCFCLQQQSLFLLENVFKRSGKIHLHKPPD